MTITIFFFAGKMGFGLFNRYNDGAIFAYVLPPARNIIAIETQKENSITKCALKCISNAQCLFFEYASDTEECTTKRIE